MDLNDTSNADDIHNYGASAAGGSAFDDGTRAGSFDRKFAGEDAAALEELVEVTVEDSVATGKRRLGGLVDAGRNRFARKMEHLSDVVEERGHDLGQPGPLRRGASDAVLRASEALDSGADYVRTRDAEGMRDDLERQIRARPLLSIGIAAGAGFLLARLLRD